jgi:hypothetical protein
MPSLQNDLTHFGPRPSPERIRGADLSPWTRELFHLRLWGRFPAGWAGALSLGLSDRRITIVRGFARKLVQGHWIAEFELQPTADAPDLRGLDFVELALAAPEPGPRAPLSLHSHFVDRSPDRGGMLFLEVRGEDRVGFLGSLLEGLAAASLSAEEMRIETQGGVAFDRLHLRGLTGQLPSEATRLLLCRWLDSVTTPRERRFDA